MREAVITINTARLKPVKIVVTQMPALLLELSDSALVIGAEEGSNTGFSIISNVSWTLEADQDWLVPDFISGNGQKYITLTAGANPDASTRQAVITVSAEGVPSKTITVTQEAGSEPTLLYITRLFDSYSVYPNPFADVLNIESALPVKKGYIELAGMDGKVIKRMDFSGQSYTFDASGLKPGSYILSIHSGDAVDTFTVVKR
jgi:hypothetical protein